MATDLPVGWHGGVYPHGTPSPSSDWIVITCGKCGEQTKATRYSELGTSDVEPEECPSCGTPFEGDEDYEYDEPDPDTGRDLYR